LDNPKIFDGKVQITKFFTIVTTEKEGVVVHVGGVRLCLLLIPQVICEYGEPQWSDIDRGKPKDSERNFSKCHFFHHKSHMD
jgi:hypothetical protein